MRFGQNQRRQKVVVPDPHGIEDQEGDSRRAENGQNDLEERLAAGAAVNEGCFLEFVGNRFQETVEDKHRHGAAKAAIQQNQQRHGEAVNPVQLGAVDGPASESSVTETE